MKLRLIATSTPRSGTVYTAKLLTSLGMPCGHESVFKSAGAEHVKKVFKGKEKPILSFVSKREEGENAKWVDVNKIVAECSYLAVPFLRWPILEDIPLLHIVRHPMKVISSLILDYNFLADNTPRWQHKWIDQILVALPRVLHVPDQITRVCYFYTEWHRLIMEEKRYRPYFRHQIESGPTQELLKFIGVNRLPRNYHENKKTNSGMEGKERRARDLTLDDIPNSRHKREFVKTCNLFYGKSFL